MTVYTIYNKPLDYPGKFVIKKWNNDKGIPVQDPNYKFVHISLEACRAEMRKKGLIVIPRFKNDDPVILESYI